MHAAGELSSQGSLAGPDDDWLRIRVDLPLPPMSTVDVEWVYRHKVDSGHVLYLDGQV